MVDSSAEPQPPARSRWGRRPPPMPPRVPVNVEPTTVFEYHVISRLDHLEKEIAALKKGNEWLLRLVVGGFVAVLLDMLFN